MDTPMVLLTFAAVAGAAAVFLHVLAKEKHRLETAYRQQRRHIARERKYEENLRRNMADQRKRLTEGAAAAIERMARGARPAELPPRAGPAAPAANAKAAR